MGTLTIVALVLRALSGNAVPLWLATPMVSGIDSEDLTLAFGQLNEELGPLGQFPPKIKQRVRQLFHL